MQWRILTHLQAVPNEGTGLAAWLIFPDVLGRPSSKTLVMVGVVETWDRRWMEILGGVLLNGGRVEPVVDVRFSKRDLETVEMFLEIQHNIHTHTFYLNPIIAVLVEVEGVWLKPGIELDWFAQTNEQVLLYGPRLSLGLNAIEASLSNIQVTAAYKIRNAGPDIFRMYLLINL